MASGKSASNKDMNGLKILNLGTPTSTTDAATKAYVDTGVTTAESRANHTGTQTASTISDFNAAVRTSSPDQLATMQANLNFGGFKGTNQADPTTAQDSATKNYVDTQLAGVVAGMVPKGSVRVASTTNVTLSAPGTTINGVTMNTGDLFLATAQTTGSENGPYTYNGSAVAATRAPNWDTNAEATLGSFWVVREGTRADNIALLTNDSAITLGTTVEAFNFTPIGGTAYVPGGAQNSPAVAAGGTWTFTHNLGTTDVVVQVKRVASPFDFIDVFCSTPDANTVTVQPDIAMASGEYRVVVRPI